VPFKARKCRQQNDHSEFFFIFVGVDDLIAEGFGHAILLRNEELIFNVDELFGIVNEVDISVHDRMLSLSFLEANRPHRLTSYDLMGLQVLVAFGGIVYALVEDDVFEANAVAMVDDILGVEFVEELLEFVDILKMGCVKLHLLFVDGSAISL
jgi:hypothetical protein